MIDKIKAEIERRKRQFRFACADDAFYHREKREMVVAYEELDRLLSFIESLEQEQDSNLDFQQFAKEMDAIFALPASQTKNTEDEPLNWEYVIAKHFYELGLNAKANVPKIKGWVARLKNGELELGSNKQRYYEFRGEMHIADEGPVMLIDKSLFPELHWLDEPIEVELTISRVSK